MGEDEKEEEAEHASDPKIYKVVLGSIKMFVVLYMAIIVAILAGFTVLEPLLSTLGAVVLFGVSFTTTAIES